MYSGENGALQTPKWQSTIDLWSHIDPETYAEDVDVRRVIRSLTHGAFQAREEPLFVGLVRASPSSTPYCLWLHPWERDGDTWDRQQLWAKLMGASLPLKHEMCALRLYAFDQVRWYVHWLGITEQERARRTLGNGLIWCDFGKSEWCADGSGGKRYQAPTYSRLHATLVLRTAYPGARVS